MRWPFVLGITLLAGFLGTGCPEIYGKGGYLDDAMEEDIKEQWRERDRERELEMARTCPDGRAKVEICDGPEGAKKCRWECP